MQQSIPTCETCGTQIHTRDYGETQCYTCRKARMPMQRKTKLRTTTPGRCMFCNTKTVQGNCPRCAAAADIR
jgi:hypothetical protein